jgi:hypothetical protein
MWHARSHIHNASDSNSGDNHCRFPPQYVSLEQVMEYVILIHYSISQSQPRYIRTEQFRIKYDYKTYLGRNSLTSRSRNYLLWLTSFVLFPRCFLNLATLTQSLPGSPHLLSVCHSTRWVAVRLQLQNALYFCTVIGLNDRSNSVRPGLEMNWKFCVRENNLLRILTARNFQARFRWTFSRGVCWKLGCLKTDLALLPN